MFPPHPTELAHLLLSSEIAEGDFAIDATAGNGYDSVFLANAVGEKGKVAAIDIQAQAIEETKRRLASAGLLSRVSLHCECHTKLRNIADGKSPSIVLFNLGFLPGSDRSVITNADKTLLTIQAAAEILLPHGMISIVCYPGHEGGDEESRQVEAYISKLAGFRSARYGMFSVGQPAPFLLMARKIK
jgi:tRNA A58 N-methylase Trm61